MYTAVHEIRNIFTAPKHCCIRRCLADRTSLVGNAEGVSVIRGACTGEPAEPTPTEEQCELQEGDNSMEFKTRGAYVPLCNPEKHDVRATERESDSEYTAIADDMKLVAGELKILTSGEYRCTTLSNR